MVRLLRRIYTNQNIIRTAKIDRFLMKLYARWMNFRGQGKIHTVFTEISSKCNLSCANCYRTDIDYPSKNMDMSIDTFKYIVDSIPYKTQFLVMQGFGESTCNPEFLSILRYASLTKKFNTIILNSNLLNKDADYYLSLLNNGLDRLIVSIDSFDEEICNQLRKGSDIERLYDTLTKINERYRNNIEVRITVSKVNMNDVENTLEKLVGINIEKIVIGILEDYKKDMVSIDKSGEKMILSIIKKYAKKVNILLDRYGICVLPFTTASFNVRGNVMPCCRIFDDEVVNFGNINSGIENTLFSDKFNTIRKTFYKKMPYFCKDCSHYSKI